MEYTPKMRFWLVVVLLVVATLVEHARF